MSEDDKSLEARVTALERKASDYEQAVVKLCSMVKHTDDNTQELVTLFHKAKIIFSFLEFLGKMAAPIGWLLAALVTLAAAASHLKPGVLFSLFK